MSIPFDRQASGSELQAQLRDLICLAVVGDHVRWVLTDEDELSDWLGKAADQWRRWADQVAMQLVASGIAPDGRLRSLIKDISLNWVPDGWLSGDDGRRLIAQRLALVAEWARYRESQANDADHELFELVATGLEAQLGVRRKREDVLAGREVRRGNTAVDTAHPRTGR
jgi:hypothetical protein